MSDLRSFIFLDQLQPQTLAYVASWMRGVLPRHNMAAQIIEIAPGLDIEGLTDVALKGQTVSSSYKPATLDNGVNILVPLFIENDDTIVVDTRTMEYIKKI